MQVTYAFDISGLIKKSTRQCNVDNKNRVPASNTLLLFMQGPTHAEAVGVVLRHITSILLHAGKLEFKYKNSLLAIEVKDPT